MRPKHPIGVFDSGMGGLTVLKEIVKRLPDYDYLYLGDNARAPYGPRSFDTVYEFTLQSVKQLFAMGCPLVILACNTASAKALRNIQQKDLPKIAPDNRVLGVIRPTAEIVGSLTKNKKIGVLGTQGTVNSNSYPIEIAKFSQDVSVTQEACPMWVPLVENNEHLSVGADYFVKKHLDHILHSDPGIDTIILGCTHYPLLLDTIKKFLPSNIQLIAQGEIVAEKLEDYLLRHPEMEQRISKEGKREFYTTDSPEQFDASAKIFFGEKIKSRHLHLD
ncbi:MAG TPA: glutamate racemase [Flavobacteriales bacterium]|nr:glutamate racemase [Flavobacteriales bacterium]HRJ34877.1 glutamate racemase [Flavobacteriales bacterium]HRJ38558.1 glutamate racemase [Flavobacteriales bacterium]